MTGTTTRRLSTGIDGLDAVVGGGFISTRSYLVRGEPGTGKTILGLHYLTAGAANDENCLFVHLEEPERNIRDNATTLGLDLSGIEFLDLSPDATVFTEDRQYDVFAPEEVDGPSIRESIIERVRVVDPDRVFVDPLSQFRHLAPDEYQFRKQVTGFMQFLKDQEATVVFTSQETPQTPDDDLQYLSDGTVSLARGRRGRTVTVPKFRGSDTANGEHAVRIGDDGMAVFPILRPESHHEAFAADSISSGVPEVDQLLHGGLERGTVTILSGPTGVGKTTLGTQFMKEAAGRGERSVIYMFEEDKGTFLARSEAVNIPASRMIDRGTLAVEPVEPLERSPAEFASMVRREVESRDAEIVMIDGIDGYRLSIQGAESELERELNSLSRYLKNMGVAVILVDSVDAITGEFRPTSDGVSYLADNIVFLRYIEVEGVLRKAIGVLKKRTSDFERSLREFEITKHGITVGDSLDGLRGVLSGAPEFAAEFEGER